MLYIYIYIYIYIERERERERERLWSIAVPDQTRSSLVTLSSRYYGLEIAHDDASDLVRENWIVQ